MPRVDPRTLARDLVALALAAAAVMAGVWILGWRPGEPVAFWSDLPSYFDPKYRYAAERIANWELPLWNPYEFTGIPFLASFQPGVFYPPLRVFYGLLPPEAAYDWFFGFHLALSCLFSFCLLRSLGTGRWPAVLAAGWALQPSWLVRVYDHPIYYAGAAWLPLLILLVWRVIQRPTLRSAAWLAAAAVLQALSGYPPLILATAYVLLATTPFAWFARRQRDAAAAARVVATLLAAAGLAALICAAQLLPTAEMAAATNRAVDASSMQAGLTEPGDDTSQLRFILSTPQATVGAAALRAWLDFGPLVLGLALASLLSAAARRWLAFALVAIGIPVVLFSVHAHRLLPLYSLVRFSLEWTLIAPVLVFAAAGLGLDAIAARAGTRLRPAGPAPALAAVAVLVLTTAWNTGNVPAKWLASTPRTDPPIPDALRTTCNLEPGGDRVYWPQGQARGLLLRNGIASAAGYEQSLLPTRIERLAEPLGLGNGMPGFQFVRGIAAHPQLAARFGLACVVSHRDGSKLEASGFERVAGSELPTLVYHSEAALPRARLRYQVRRAASAEQSLALVLGAEVDARTAVVLEPGAPDPTGSCESGSVAESEVRIRSYAPESVEVAVSSPCAGILVLADAYFPGWIARVGGEPAAIHPADHAFRAVAVPAGEHVVEFQYRPQSVRIGSWLSTLGLAVWVAILWISSRRGSSV